MDTRALAPLQELGDDTTGPELPLPEALRRFYGALRLEAPADRPHCFANFVSSIDGVVSLGEPATGGDEISGGSREDRAVMGLLRAAADRIVVGAGTLRAFPRHVWTPEAIYAPYAPEYARLRAGLGLGAPAPTILVTASGDLDPTLPVFTHDRARAAVVTTPEGARRLRSRGGDDLDVRVIEATPPLHADDILRAAAPAAGGRVLLECGPTLMAAFFEARRVDELFLTLAPQVAGRAPGAPREGLVAGALLLPERPAWADLVGLKRGGSLLYLRYRFVTRAAK